MKRNILDEVVIPEDVDISIDETGNFNVKGPKGETSKKLVSKLIGIKVKDKKVIFSCEKASRKEKSIINAYKTHVRNLIKGVQEPYVYELKICSGHFPMSVKNNGSNIVIENFLGEKVPRKTSIKDDVSINISGDKILLESVNKESAGESATRIERATKIKGRDRRVFQDGIFVVRKAGVLISK